MGKGIWIGIVVILLLVGGWALMRGLAPEPAQTSPASGTESSAQNTAVPASAVSGSVASDEELYTLEDSNIDDSVVLSDEAVIEASQ